MPDSSRNPLNLSFVLIRLQFSLLSPEQERISTDTPVPAMGLKALRQSWL